MKCKTICSCVHVFSGTTIYGTKERTNTNFWSSLRKVVVIKMIPTTVPAPRFFRPHRKIRRFGDGWQSRFSKSALPVNGRIEANRIAERLSVTPPFEDLDFTHKPQKAARHPLMPHTPSGEPSESPRHFAASMDESVIVGYYTSAEVLLRSPRPSATPERKEKSYGKKRWN